MSADIAGQRFGRLVAIRFADRDKHGNQRWLCRCDCGNEKVILKFSLGKTTRSCGCLLKEESGKRASKLNKTLNAKKFTKHGHAGDGSHVSPTYSTWKSMKQRCTNPNSQHYPRYGGEGVKVCERWINSFEAFLSDMGEKPDGLSIDRIDPFGNYEPSNCRWADDETQRQNKRRNSESRAA